MAHLLVQVFDRAHDVTASFGVEPEDVADATGNAHTLLMAIIHVQGAVTGGLIGVEITFNQETRSALAQHAIVAVVLVALGGDGIVVLSAPETDVATDTGIGTAVIAVGVNLVHVVRAPHFLAHFIAALHAVAGEIGLLADAAVEPVVVGRALPLVIAAVEDCRVVG